MRPLADLFTTRLVAWLPKGTCPIRQGAHFNGAFGLHRALGYARSLADTALLDTITATARRWFGSDADYPGDWEPDGADFLSPALCEAVLMADLLPGGEFVPWLDRFLPALADERPAALFTPAVVSDHRRPDRAPARPEPVPRMVLAAAGRDAAGRRSPRAADAHGSRTARRAGTGQGQRDRLHGRVLAGLLCGALPDVMHEGPGRLHAE
jgi:hypothetical protein